MTYQTHKKNNLKNILKDMPIMKKYRLQLLSHGQIFNSREQAVDYINRNFKKFALWAEPAIIYYENEDGELRMILTVGATQDPDHKRIYIMDDGELRDLVNNSVNTVNEFADSVATISDDLQSTINAAGLVLDENNINDRVEYRPNINDDVIKNSTTLAEAIEAVSSYAQEVMEFAEETKKHDVVYKPRNAEHNVKVTITEPEDDGDGNMISLVSADVKVSEDEYNMLQIRDNRLFVPTISGSATSSTNTDVIDDANGGKTIKTSIKDNYFGLTADGNKITLSVGDTKQTVTLPGIEIVKRMEYDEETNKLKIIYASGENGSEESFIEIEINDLFDITEFNEEIAIVQDKIDQEIADRTSADDAINDAIDEVNVNISNIEQQITATRTGAGLKSDGSYESNQATNYIKTATSLNDADRILDGAIKDNRDELESLIDANVQSLSDTINAIANDTESPSSNYNLNVRVSDLESDVESIELRLVDPSNPRLYGLYVDNDPRGQVEIPQNELLKEVLYEDNKLILIFENNERIEINLSDLIDAYSGGKGISISNNVVSVKLSDTNANLLEFDRDSGCLQTKNIVATIDDVNNVENSLNELTERIESDYATKDELASKADADNYYTKTESDNKYQLKLTNSNTVSIDTVLTQGDEIKTTANVKIKTMPENDPNVIKADENGLYVNVFYNSATNTLTFNDKQFVLSAHSVVTGGEYDPNTNELVLYITDETTGSEGEKQIRIPVSSLVSDMVKVSDTDTVHLEMLGEGDKTIRAYVNISEINAGDLYDQRENAIVQRTDGIFASMYADKYNAYRDGQYNNIITIQEYLDELSDSIKALNTNVQNLDGRITNLENIISAMIGEDGDYADFADYGERIARLETMVGDYNDYQGDNDPSNDGWGNNTF